MILDAKAAKGKNVEAQTLALAKCRMPTNNRLMDDDV